MSPLAILIQHSTENSGQCNRQEKEIKGIQIGKEEIKLILLAEYLICLCKKSQGIYNNKI